MFHADQDSVRFVIFQKSASVLHRNLGSSLKRFLLAYGVVLHVESAVAASAPLLPGGSVCGVVALSPSKRTETALLSSYSTWSLRSALFSKNCENGVLMTLVCHTILQYFFPRVKRSVSRGHEAIIPPHNDPVGLGTANH